MEKIIGNWFADEYGNWFISYFYDWDESENSPEVLKEMLNINWGGMTAQVASKTEGHYHLLTEPRLVTGSLMMHYYQMCRNFDKIGYYYLEPVKFLRTSAIIDRELIALGLRPIVWGNILNDHENQIWIRGSDSGRLAVCLRDTGELFEGSLQLRSGEISLATEIMCQSGLERPKRLGFLSASQNYAMLDDLDEFETCEAVLSGRVPTGFGLGLRE